MTRQASSKTWRRSAGISISIFTENGMRRGAAPADAVLVDGAAAPVVPPRPPRPPRPPVAAAAPGSGAGGGAYGERVDAAALQEVNGAAVAAPLGLAAAAESAASAAASATGAGVGRGR